MHFVLKFIRNKEDFQYHLVYSLDKSKYMS